MSDIKKHIDEVLKCPKCGNNKIFYREISVKAKLKVNNKRQDLKTVYDIDKTIIDDYFEDYVYCSKCDFPISDIKTK